MSTMSLTRLMLPVCLMILVVDRAVQDQVDVQIAGNVTATLCQTKHLCQNKGCKADSNRSTACQCDRACSFFDDCCVDYPAWCSREENGDDFLNRLGVASFQCTSVDVDSEGAIPNRNFWMVNRCPGGMPTTGNVSVIRTNCETPTSDNPLTLIPQTDVDRNVTFANVYCALCHGQPLNKLREWDLQTSCPEPVYNSLVNSSFTTKLKTIWNECGHHFVLPQTGGYGASDGLTSRPCLTPLVGDSNCANSLRSTDGQVADACTKYTAVVMSTTGTHYKNPTCYAGCELRASMNYTLECLSNSFPLILPHVLTVPGTASEASSENVTVLIQPAPSEPIVTFPLVTRLPPMRPPPAPPPDQTIFLSISDILDFYPFGDDTGYSCPEGDLHDPFSNMCLSPRCDQGFVYNRVQGSCVPVPIPLPIEGFGCFDGRDFSHVRDSLFITVDVDNSFETGGNSFQRALEQCIRESLDIDLMYLDESVDGEDFLEDGDGEMSLFSQRDGGTVRFRIVPSSIGELNETAEVDGARRSRFDAIVAKIGRRLSALGQNGDGGEDGEAVDEDSVTFSPCRIQRLQVIQSCGDSLSTDRLNSCNQTEWVPRDNDNRSQVINQSLIVFDIDEQSWYTVSRYNIRILYQKRIMNESIIFNQSDVEIGVCSSGRTRVSCPSIKLDASQFEPLDDDDLNGSLVFKPKGITLNQDEYIRTADGKIKVCVSLGLLERSLLDFNLPQAILSRIGFGISVTASTLTLITYAVFPSLHRRTRKAIMAMVASLTAAQTLFLFSGLIAAANQHACTAAAIASHFLWLSSLTWTNVLAFLLWSTFAKRSPSPSTSQLGATTRVTALTFAYAFGIPIVILIPCAVVNFCSCTNVPQIYGSSSSCWINSGLTNFVVFGVPMAVFLVINMILFVWTVWVIRNSQRRSAQLHTGRGTKEVLIYIRIASLMGFTWVFGFSAAFADVPALSYIFIVLNSLQGFFIFLSFTFTSQVKKLWHKKLASQLSYVRCFALSKIFKSLRHTDKTATTSTSVSAGVSASEATLEMSSTSRSTGGGVDNNNEEINKLRYERHNQENSWMKRLVPVIFSKPGHRGSNAEPQTVEAQPKPIVPPKPRSPNNDSGSRDQPRSPNQPQSSQRPLPRIPFTSEAFNVGRISDANSDAENIRSNAIFYRDTKPPLPKRRNVQTTQE